MIADRMRQLRKRQGWSAQRLGEEMKSAGIPWDRSIVANIENGRRTFITVEELLSLAAVLDVPPTYLLIPDSSAPLCVTEQAVAYAPELFEWVAAKAWPPGWMAGDPGAVRRWNEARALLEALGKFRGASAWRAMREDGDATRESALSDFIEVVHEMIEGGAYPPPLPQRVVDQMREHGFRYADQVRIAPGAEGVDSGTD